MNGITLKGSSELEKQYTVIPYGLVQTVDISAPTIHPGALASSYYSGRISISQDGGSKITFEINQFQWLGLKHELALIDELSGKINGL